MAGGGGVARCEAVYVAATGTGGPRWPVANL